MKKKELKQVIQNQKEQIERLRVENISLKAQVEVLLKGLHTSYPIPDAPLKGGDVYIGPYNPSGDHGTAKNPLTPEHISKCISKATHP